MPPEQPFIHTPENQHPEHLPLTIETVDAANREKKAREICSLGNYETILSEFKKPENRILLEEQKEHVKTLHPESLERLSPALQNEHWEILTLIYLFDTETYEHCIRTYDIVRQKLETDHQVGTFLKQSLAIEKVSPNTLLIAALLHDAGKIGIPFKNLLLNNTFTDAEWHELHVRFCQEEHRHNTKEEAENHVKSILNESVSHNKRSKDFVPVRTFLTPEQRALLETSGINPDLSLGKIIDTHQDLSGKIAERYALDPVIIDLVSNHHERIGDPKNQYPVSRSTLKIATILRFADVFDAIHSRRPYKKGNPFLTTVAIIIEQVRNGFIDQKLAHLWIEEDMSRLDQNRYFEQLPEAIDEEHEDDPHYSSQDREKIIREEREALTTIENFLNKPIPEAETRLAA